MKHLRWLRESSFARADLSNGGRVRSSADESIHVRPRNQRGETRVNASMPFCRDSGFLVAQSLAVNLPFMAYFSNSSFIVANRVRIRPRLADFTAACLKTALSQSLRC